MSAMSFVIVAWMILASIGGGLAVIRCSGLMPRLCRADQIVFAFTIGIGVMGWLVFFPGVTGYFSSPAFIVVLCAMTGGLWLLRGPALESHRQHPLSLLEWFVVIGLLAMILMDVAEALAPAADADTMAYHFETPKRYLAEGMVYGIPRAIDGITQLQLQLTYAVAMALGGDAAAPLWTMASGWALGAVFYVIAGKFMTRLWALAGTLLVMTTPAVIYGAGSGQVEVRIAAFALAGAYAVAMVAAERDRRVQLAWILVAGVIAGFFAGSKMTGLIFCFAAAVVLIGTPGTVARLLVFCLAAGLAGTQWYLFNGVVTGDPLYPLLWQYLPLRAPFDWSAHYADAARSLWEVENPVPRNLFWFVVYPFRTIISPLTGFESLRTGLGPATLLALPFAAFAAARKTNTLQSPLFRMLLIAFIFYAFWFFLGPSLKVRHLVPVYPIVLLVLMAGVAAYTDERPVTRNLLYAAFAVVLGIQLGGQLVFTKKFGAFVLGNQTRESFLRDNINGYDVVHWLNGNLSREERVFIENRTWPYLLDVPYFVAQPRLQTQIPLLPGTTDTKRFFGKLNQHGITHIAVNRLNLQPGHPIPTGRMIVELERRGCMVPLREFTTRAIVSRTLPTEGRPDFNYVVFRIDPTCTGGG